jgi:hypothetical protein
MRDHLSDPIAGLALRIDAGPITRAAFGRVDQAVADRVGTHRLLRVDLERYRLTGRPHWNCASWSFRLADGPECGSEDAVVTATAVTLLWILLDHHAVQRRLPPHSDRLEREKLARSMMIGDLIMSRIAMLAADNTGPLGDGILAALVQATSAAVHAQAGPYVSGCRTVVEPTVTLAGRPLMWAASTIAAACRGRTCPPGPSWLVVDTSIG